MTTVSSYFYFDDKLEEIAAKQYTDYQEMINDYRGYTAFKEYQSYYNTMISRISIFLQNHTLRGNSDFVVVDADTEAEAWYQRVSTEGSGCVWTYLPISLPKYDHAPAIARMIKTKKSENVGVLVIYLRPQQFEKHSQACTGFHHPLRQSAPGRNRPTPPQPGVHSTVPYRHKD